MVIRHYRSVLQNNEIVIVGTSVALPLENGRYAVGISMVGEGENGSRRIGRTIAKGRAMSATSGRPSKHSIIFDSLAHYKTFESLCYANPNSLERNLKEAYSLMCKFPELPLNLSMELKELQKVIGFLSIGLIEAFYHCGSIDILRVNTKGNIS